MTTSDNTAQMVPAPQVTIEEEMKKSYLDYAMSVIVSRALPDVRDGLKPVHRRIFYAMREGGYTADKPYRKSARIVGDVMGKYHPHGDSAIYEALARMAQDFSLRLPLIDGQGNFGSMDGDPPAAMRYTEARLNRASEQLLADIEKNTVEFRPNYDESLQEPVVLPARLPNLLINGAGGIAVGMATNIPTHNVGEVIDACCATLDNPDLTVEELMQYIPGPDFPTGGQILGRGGIRSAYATGNGSVAMRARATVEDGKDKREVIIIHDVPYQVNKSRLLERLGEVARDKVVEGISDIRDLSNREGVRIVIELQRNVQGDVVLNQLYKHTPLQTSFGCNMVALHHGRPMTLKLKDFITAFLAFREEVITRRTRHELNEARARAHILAGLAVAVANIDAVIAMIRNAPDPGTARALLMEREWDASAVAPLIELIDDPDYPLTPQKTYFLSELQAKAILDLRLHRLTGLERDKIGNELKDITDQIAYLLSILASRSKLLDVLRNELLEARAAFATPRRTEILDSDGDTDIEDLIQREDMVVTITNGGYVKRTPLATYRAQRRGGKGRAAVNMKEEDFVSELFVASTHTPILCFTSRGIVYRLKVYQLPLGNPQSRGKALVNLLPLEEGENVSVILRLPEDEEMWTKLDVMFATSEGGVRRNKLSDFRNIRSNGLIAMKLEGDEKLISVKVCRDDEDVLLVTRKGKAIRFEVQDIRVFSGRTSTGVRGIKLAPKDEVIGMSILKHVTATPDERAAYLKVANKLRGADEEGVELEAAGGDLSEARIAELQSQEQFLLGVTVKGFGKRTSAYEYRVTGRGGSGITNMSLTAKNGGEIAATFPVTDDHQVMLVTDAGQTIRLPVHDIRFTGRSAQGVTMFKVAGAEKVVSVAWLVDDEDEDEVLLDENGNPIVLEGTAEAVSDGETEAVADDAAPPSEEISEQ
jgi:DNA gyrase subunit A